MHVEDPICKRFAASTIRDLFTLARSIVEVKLKVPASNINGILEVPGLKFARSMCELAGLAKRLAQLFDVAGSGTDSVVVRSWMW